MHYLMIKKCMDTGMMYLCKTSSPNKDPYKYTGSGTRWVNHIRSHNSRIITCVIGAYDTMEELKRWGTYYSQYYDVVASPNWANLVVEQGDGGHINDQTGKRWKMSEVAKANIRASRMAMKEDGRMATKVAKYVPKISKEHNYQFKGYYVTPWGRFPSLRDAVEAAKVLRASDPHVGVITDTGTLRKYFAALDVTLSLEGRRTVPEWRGRTPREIGFIFEEYYGEN